MRKIVYVSGTRADFGLLCSTLLAAAADPDLELAVCATGMHLSPDYGETVHEIEASGLRLCGRVAAPLDASSGAAMARAVGHELLGLVDVLAAERPDLVMLLGDRGEMLAAAIAAVHLNIPVAHLHGGERSGTVDELIRHAISKLAHYHFVATEESKSRLLRMGEHAASVFVTGAPGLDGLPEMASRGRAELCRQYGLDAEGRVALVVFHPVVQQSAQAGEQMQALLRAALDSDLQLLVLMPNADAGGSEISAAAERVAANPRVRTAVHIARADYVSWLNSADIMIGNSSSGIIEAASFGIPVVNVGDRQRLRQRNHNVKDAPASYPAIRSAIAAALAKGACARDNVYGDGNAAGRIVELLKSIPLTPELLDKSNAY